MKKKLLIFMTSAIVLLTGCLNRQNNLSSEEGIKLALQNTNWTLDRIDDNLFNPLIVNGEVIGLSTLNFNEKDFHGTTGINQFRGSYEIDKNSFTTSPILTTRMGAINAELANNEAKILEILNSNDKKIEQNGDILTIFSSKGILVYKKLTLKNESAENVKLNNSVWNLVSIGDENIAELVEKYNIRNLSVQFKDNQISGFSGVNHFTGEYAVKNDTIYTTPLASTLMLGIHEDINKLEQKFLDVLSSRHLNFTLENSDTMILFYSNKERLVFTRVYM